MSGFIYRILDKLGDLAPSFLQRGAKDYWLTDLEAAKKLASSRGKDILIDFTGSDWCYWCMRLDKEVFSAIMRVYWIIDLVDLSTIAVARNPQQADAVIAQHLGTLDELLSVAVAAVEKSHKEKFWLGQGFKNDVKHIREIVKSTHRDAG